jgi:hypothetical protein
MARDPKIFMAKDSKKGELNCRYGKEHMDGRENITATDRGGVDSLGQQVNEVFNAFLKATTEGINVGDTCTSKEGEVRRE